MKRGILILARQLSTGLLLAGVTFAWVLPSLAAAADSPATEYPSRQEPGKKDAGKKEGEKETNKQETGKDSARVRYARAYLALAKLEVQIANQRNKQVAGTLPPGIMIVLEQRVALAEQWLAAAQADGNAKPGEIAVKIAEIYLKTAEANLAQGEKVNRISPQRPGVMERLRLKVDLAQAALASARELDTSSPDALVQFQIERLREEVADMHIRQIELLDRN
jgi:hypothetical protein